MTRQDILDALIANRDEAWVQKIAGTFRQHGKAS